MLCSVCSVEKPDVFGECPHVCHMHVVVHGMSWIPIKSKSKLLPAICLSYIWSETPVYGYDSSLFPFHLSDKSKRLSRFQRLSVEYIHPSHLYTHIYTSYPFRVARGGIHPGSQRIAGTIYKNTHSHSQSHLWTV